MSASLFAPPSLPTVAVSENEINQLSSANKCRKRLTEMSHTRRLTRMIIEGHIYSYKIEGFWHSPAESSRSLTSLECVSLSI